MSLLPFESAEAGPYPRNDKFKQLPITKDNWYFVDNKNWMTKSPDKFVHYMGSYSLANITYRITKDKLISSVFSIGLGLIKELDDGYREGWSKRDIYMDVGGTLSSLFSPKDVRMLCYYDQEAIYFKLSMILD